MKQFTLTNEEMNDIIQVMKPDTGMIFLAELMSITNIQGITAKLQLRDYQKNLLENFKGNYFGKHARQIGTSTCQAIYALHWLLTKNDQSVAFCAPSINICANFIEKIIDLYDSLPDHIKLIGKIVTKNKYNLIQILKNSKYWYLFILV